MSELYESSNHPNLFNIVVSKKMDIAILKTIGISRINITLMFILCGFILGIIGSIIGIILGLLISLNISKIFHFIQNIFNYKLYNNLYYKGLIPIKIEIFE